MVRDPAFAFEQAAHYSHFYDDPLTKSVVPDLAFRHCQSPSSKIKQTPKQLRLLSGFRGVP
jgi:hypothetical protein